MIKKSPENNQNTLLTQVQKTGVFLEIDNNTKNKVQNVIENNERNEIIKYCNTPLNFTRICLFRHLPYLEDANCKDYEELRKQLKKPGNTVNLEEFGKLDDNLEIDTNKANTGLFDNVFKDTDNTILIHNPKHTSKKRIQQTIEYIQSKYQGLEYKERNIVGSQKGTYSKQMSLIKTGEELIQIIDEIKQDITLYAGKNVVILGSRSHSHFLNPEKFDKTGKDDSEKEFERKGYDFIDIDIQSKQIFSIDQLIISPENYQEIKKIFQLEKENISLLTLQNGLNRFFYEYPEQYEKYIKSKNPDLRVFCIINLLRDTNKIKKLKIITNYFRGARNITKEEVNILLNNINNVCIKECYIDLCNRKIIKNPIYNDNIESLSKLLEIQSRSLDKKIKFQEGNGILERNIFRIKEEMDQNSNENSFSSIDTDIKWILSSEHKIFTLPAHVGYGKSIWISDIAKQIITDFPHIKVHFFEGKDFNNQYRGNPITESLKEKLSKIDNQTLILIDAIDEIDNPETKKTILKLISNSVNTVIVTGRLSDFDEKKNNGYVTLGLRKISKENFINSKIDDQKTRDDILNFLEKSRLSLEIETNPLLLNFVCLLSNPDVQQKNEYKEIGIKKLSDIENKSDLYENITKLIIYEHFRSKGKSSSQEELKGALNNLCEYAYKIFKGKALSISDEYLNKLSIIFKKSETGEYQFIHHSFYEFFLAKYLSQDPNGNEEIYTVRDEKAGEKNWNTWKKFKPTVLFYAELLMNEANNKTNIDRISDLLSDTGLRKNDDVFGEGFFMCLHIIHHGMSYATKKCHQLHCTINTITSEDTTINKFAIIDALYDILITYAEYRRIFGEYTNKYVTEIYTWSNKDLINKSFLFQDFQKSIGYEKNEFGGHFTDKIIHSTLSKSSKNYEFIKHRYYHRMIINMGIDNPDVYNESFKKSWENEKLNRGFPKIQNNAELNYFYGMKIINDLFCVWEHAEWLQYNSAGNYFLLAAKEGYKDSIDRLFLCTDELIKEPSNTILVLSWLIELGNDIAINKILEYIKNEKLEIKKWYFKSKVESLSELFIFSKNPEAILFIKSVFLQLLKSDKENENTLLKLYGIFIEAGEQKYIQDIQLPENLIKTYESLNKKKVISTDTDFFTEIYDNFYVLLKNKDFLKALGSIYTLRIYKKISTDEIAEMLNKLENESTEYFEQKPEDEKLYWNFKEELEEELHISGIIPFNSNNVFNKKGEYSYYQFIKEFINSNNKII